MIRTLFNIGIPIITFCCGFGLAWLLYATSHALDQAEIVPQPDLETIPERRMPEHQASLIEIELVEAEAVKVNENNEIAGCGAAWAGCGFGLPGHNYNDCPICYGRYEEHLANKRQSTDPVGFAI